MAHLFSLSVIREIFARQVQQGTGPADLRQPATADADRSTPPVDGQAARADRAADGPSRLETARRGPTSGYAAPFLSVSPSAKSVRHAPSGAFLPDFRPSRPSGRPFFHSAASRRPRCRPSSARRGRSPGASISNARSGRNPTPGVRAVAGQDRVDRSISSWMRMDARRRPAMARDDRAAGIGIVERRPRSPRRRAIRAASALSQGAALVPWRSPMTISAWPCARRHGMAIEQQRFAVTARRALERVGRAPDDRGGGPASIRRLELGRGRSGGATARHADGSATGPGRGRSAPAVRPAPGRSPRSRRDRPPPRRDCSRSRPAGRAG